MMYKVKEVADLVGVSVRTLHYYDRIQLLPPHSVSSAGYRLYSNKDLERLQQILFLKEMGFSLTDIGEILDNPSFDRKEALEYHRKVLFKKKKRLEEMIQTVSRTLDAMERGSKMNKDEMFKGFDMRDIQEYQTKYAEEIREKYGKETVERVNQKTSTYSEADWERIQQEQKKVFERIGARMPFGPEDEEVQRAVTAWRQHITANFYDCTVDIFRGLADLYVNDKRFKKNIDRTQKGLA
ncbi:MerR family transcriptional regulator [Bacillus spongiae]|uniref:MerR family transcriptional regulator n=1 Tax=Bacillus spongiae TaxID=2683610 RepID=A0ABU8HHV4_9BACI